MPAKKPLVIVTRKLPDAIETRMRELFDARLNLDDKPMGQAELIEAVQKADVLVRPSPTDRFQGDRAGGPNLKLIANFGTGVDNIDVKTALDKGIVVTNTPGVLTEDTADMTMALILAVPRRLVEGVKELEDDHFKGWSPNWMLGTASTASGWASSAWGGSARRWRGGRAPSDCRSIITTESRCTPTSSTSWRRPIGEPRPDAGAGWTSCRSTARTRRRPITS